MVSVSIFMKLNYSHFSPPLILSMSPLQLILWQAQEDYRIISKYINLKHKKKTKRKHHLLTLKNGKAFCDAQKLSLLQVTIKLAKKIYTPNKPRSFESSYLFHKWRKAHMYFGAKQPESSWGSPLIKIIFLYSYAEMHYNNEHVTTENSSVEKQSILYIKVW